MRVYYLRLAIIGLVAEFILAWIIMGKYLFQMFDLSFKDFTWTMYPITLIGILSTLGMAKFLDTKQVPVKWTTPAAMIIYLSGIIPAAVINFVLNGLILSSHFTGFGNAFFDWFIKPMYWGSVIGIPASLALGSFYQISHLLMKRIRD